MMVTVLPANSGCCPATGPVKNGDATRHSATATTNALITLTFPHPPAGSRKDGTVGSQVNVSVLYDSRYRLPLAAKGRSATSRRGTYTLMSKGVSADGDAGRSST